MNEAAAAIISMPVIIYFIDRMSFSGALAYILLSSFENEAKTDLLILRKKGIINIDDTHENIPRQILLLNFSRSIFSFEKMKVGIGLKKVLDQQIFTKEFPVDNKYRFTVYRNL
jgi:hypothetical protein